MASSCSASDGHKRAAVNEKMHIMRRERFYIYLGFLSENLHIYVKNQAVN